jgi:hypothetical protein
VTPGRIVVTDEARERGESVIALAIIRDADARLAVLRAMPSTLALLLVQRAHRRAAVERGGYD